MWKLYTSEGIKVNHDLAGMDYSIALKVSDDYIVPTVKDPDTVVANGLMQNISNTILFGHTTEVVAQGLQSISNEDHTYLPGIVQMDIYLDSTLKVVGIFSSSVRPNINLGIKDGFKLSIYSPSVGGYMNFRVSIGSKDINGWYFLATNRGTVNNVLAIKSGSYSEVNRILNHGSGASDFAGSNDSLMEITGLNIVEFSMLSEVDKYANAIIQSEVFNEYLNQVINNSTNSVYSKVAGLFIKR